jgi:hypothetical protein
MRKIFLLGIIIFLLSGCSSVPKKLPSWLSFSVSDVSSVRVQGWGPGADGNFTIKPSAEQLSTIVNSLVKKLSQDKAIRPHATSQSQGGESWLVVQLKNGSSIEFKDFPNETKPIQYRVILTSSSGKEKTTMISDTSGVVKIAIQEITSKDVMMRNKAN